MDEYQTYLLELIAYLASPGNMEFEAWRVTVKERFNAATPKAKVSKETAKPQPPAHDERKDDVGVRINAGEKAAHAQRR